MNLERTRFGLRNFGEKKRTNVIGALCAGSLLTAALFTCNQGASGLIKDFGTSKSAKIESLPSAFILLGGTAPSQAGCDENYVFFSANLLLYAFTAR